LPAHRDAVKSILVYITENPDTSVDPVAAFPDFLRLLALTGGERGMPRSEAEAVKEAFQVYDEYGTGYVSSEVFRSILESLGDTIVQEEIEYLIEVVSTT
jgi:Ca2+-binding EF-hand superfamily protein